MASTASRSPASSDVHPSRRRHPPLYLTLIHDTTAAPADLILDEAELATQSTRMRTATRMHHPRLHYLFLDDPDDPEYPSPLASATQQQRVLIVDFADDAQSILRTTSLSPDWQVTSTSTSALAMRSSSSTAPYRTTTTTTTTTAAADIGKMLTIEGVGASAENFEVISHVVKKKRMQASTAVPAETDLGNAFMYADLFNQTNQRLESLIQQSPPSLYTDTLARLKTELNHLSDVINPTDSNNNIDNSANSLHENLANTARMRESLAALRTHSQSQSTSSSLQGGASRDAAAEEGSEQSEQSEESEESESEESEEEQSEHSEEEDDDQPMFATELPPTSTHPSPSPSASLPNDNNDNEPTNTLAASVADLNLTLDDPQLHPTASRSRSTAHEDDVHSSQSSHEDLVPRS